MAMGPIIRSNGHVTIIMPLWYVHTYLCAEMWIDSKENLDKVYNLRILMGLFQIKWKSP